MQSSTQLTEAPGRYEEKFNSIKSQMMKNSKLVKKYSETEIEVMIKSSLILEAIDKIEFSLRGALRRNNLKKLNKRRELEGLEPQSPEDWEDSYRSNMKDQLKDAGFPFTLTKDELSMLAVIEEKGKKESADEVSQIASEAMKRILKTV